MEPIRLAIIEDHKLFRITLVKYLANQPNIEIALHTADTLSLLHKLKSTPVDILLTDVHLSPIDGTELLQTIRNEYPEIKVLILSASTDLNLISAMLDLGIHGFISKDDEPEDLLNAIIALADNKIYHTRLFTEALFRSKQQTIRQDINKQVSLNDREKKVLLLLWEEKSNKDIADELYLSTRSVEKIRQDMKDKLGVKTTIGLIKYAIQKKLIEPGHRKADRVNNHR